MRPSNPWSPVTSNYSVSIYSGGFLGSVFSHFFFFFQAEDGIRDVAVTGVQTCALPIYDLASRGIPVYTVLAQSLNRFIEFRERNATDGFDLTSVDPFHVPLTQNVPVKVLMLHTAWELTGLTNETSGGVTSVNFTVSATNLAYTHVLDSTNLSDGMLNRVAFTFHLVVGTHDVTANVPWYRVTVDDGNRYDITHVEFLGYR